MICNHGLMLSSKAFQDILGKKTMFSLGTLWSIDEQQLKTARQFLVVFKVMAQLKVRKYCF